MTDSASVRSLCATGVDSVSDASGSSASNKALLVTIGVVLAGYLVAAAFHLPQHGTELIVAGQSHGRRRNIGGDARGGRRRVIRRTGW